MSVRGWDRYSGPGQRPRLGAEPGGGLQVAWTTKAANKRMQATLEDGGGRVLEQRPALITLPEYHPASPLGGHLLFCDGNVLRWGPEVPGVGGWEAYAGYAAPDGRAAFVAWQPCPSRPCPASVLYQQGGKWYSRVVNLEIFGVALGPAGPGRVALAMRANPANSGWTLRILDEMALLERGEIADLEAVQVWKPPAGLSLENPRLVQGAGRAILIGEAYDLRAARSSGRVFLAEAGGQLREVLQAWPSDGNVEVAGAELGGVLYVAAESADGRSALWRWQGGGLVLLGDVPGEAPSLGLAEGSLWMSSTRGLWRLE